MRRSPVHLLLVAVFAAVTSSALRAQLPSWQHRPAAVITGSAEASNFIYYDTQRQVLRLATSTQTGVDIQFWEWDGAIWLPTETLFGVIVSNSGSAGQSDTSAVVWDPQNALLYMQATVNGVLDVYAYDGATLTPTGHPGPWVDFWPVLSYAGNGRVLDPRTGFIWDGNAWLPATTSPNAASLSFGAVANAVFDATNDRVLSVEADGVYDWVEGRSPNEWQLFGPARGTILNTPLWQASRDRILALGSDLLTGGIATAEFADLGAGYAWQDVAQPFTGAGFAVFAQLGHDVGRGEFVMVLTDFSGHQTYVLADGAPPASPPVIQNEPQSLTVCEGGTASFSVTASGAAPLAYQWRVDGAPIAGATASTLTIDPVALADAGAYDVVVTNPDGSATSQAAQLTVQALPQAEFDALVAISTTGPSATAIFRDLSTGTVSSWLWDFGDGNTSTEQNPTHTYQTSGTFDVSLTVSGSCGASTETKAGFINVPAPPSPLILDFSVSDPVVTDGEAITLTHDFFNGSGVIDQGVGPVSPGQTPGVLPPPSATTVYTLTVTNSAGESVSATAQVTSHAPPSITNLSASAAVVTNGDSVDLLPVFSDGSGVLAGGGLPPTVVTSGVAVNVVPLDDATTTYTLTVTNPAGATAQASVDVLAVAPAVIDSFLASPPSVVNGETTDLIGRFSGGVGVIEPGTLIASSGVPVTVLPPPDATTLYVLTVTNAAGDSVMAPAYVTSAAGLPVITNQPLSQTVALGANVTFSVVATGSGLSYQWCKDGVPLAGETQSTLSITAATAADAGRYQVKVSNSAGTVVSDAAVLTVTTGCPDCNGLSVRIDTDLIADFSTSPPSWQGDPALAPYVSFDTSGPTPESWKMIIDTGRHRLEVVDAATVSTGMVAQSGRWAAPGLEVRTSCTVYVGPGAALQVESRSAQAGELRILADGDVLIDGVVSNRGRANAGASGRVIVASRCGDVRIGPSGLVHTGAGSDIHLLAGGDPVAGPGGDVVVAGLVEAVYHRAPAPAVRIAALDGGLTVIGTNLRQVIVRGRRITTSGVVVRASRSTAAAAGRIELQAQGDLAVVGNTVQHFAYPNPGAVGIKLPGLHGGGVIDARSIGGRILAVDRAFDNVNHDNGAALNRLWAAGDVHLLVSGVPNSSPRPGKAAYRMPVVDVSTVGNASAGTNELRSFGGQVALVGRDTMVLATTWSPIGTPGINLLTSCLGVVNGGIVLPADAFTADDSGVCAPPAPPPLISGATALGVVWP